MSLPKRVSEMTVDERLESLTAWCEEQKFVKPGECGTIGPGRIRQVAYAGPVRYVHHQYAAPIAPPSYETAMAESAKKNKKAKKGGLVKRLLERTKQKSDGYDER